MWVVCARLWFLCSGGEDIQKDASDPQLLANLRELGQVSVDHRMSVARTVRLHIISAWAAYTQAEQEAAVHTSFASRAQAEADAAGATTPRNRLWAYALAAMLEEPHDRAPADGREH